MKKIILVTLVTFFTTLAVHANECSHLWNSSKEIWLSLTLNEKLNAIENEALKRNNYNLKANVPKRKIEKDLFKSSYKDLMDRAGRETIENDIINIERIFTVGNPYPLFFEVAYLTDGTIVGGKIASIQEGGAFDNASSQKHFKTRKESLAAGAEISDVSWQSHGIFIINEDGKLILYPPSWSDTEFDFHWTGW